MPKFVHKPCSKREGKGKSQPFLFKGKRKKPCSKEKKKEKSTLFILFRIAEQICKFGQKNVALMKNREESHLIYGGVVAPKFRQSNSLNHVILMVIVRSKKR